MKDFRGPALLHSTFAANFGFQAVHRIEDRHITVYLNFGSREFQRYELPVLRRELLGSDKSLLLPVPICLARIDGDSVSRENGLHARLVIGEKCAPTIFA